MVSLKYQEKFHSKCHAKMVKERSQFQKNIVHSMERVNVTDFLLSVTIIHAKSLIAICFLLLISETI
jgi:hypothetical protein